MFILIESILIILFCWTLPVALILPSYINGKTGLIEVTGSCTFIPNSDDDCSNLGETLLYSIGFGIPSGLILLSYFAIFVKVDIKNKSFFHKKTHETFFKGSEN